MSTLTVTLKDFGTEGVGGTVYATPRVVDALLPQGSILRHGPWRITLNDQGSQAGTGTLSFPADAFPDVAWDFRLEFAGNKISRGPYTAAQIAAVSSLAALIDVEPLGYVATSTVIERLEALEAGGGGGGGGPVAWVDITGKPLTFPPATHGHPWSEITGKPLTFTPSSHTHGAGDLTGVVKTVNGTAPDGSGNVVVSGGGGGGGPLTGTGFPEGNVSAMPGTEYIDTAATNGAIKWIKATGTGSTGWRVVYGDTGWRDISAVVNGPWAAEGYSITSIRRQNQTVFLWFDRLENPNDTTLRSSPAFSGFGWKAASRSIYPLPMRITLFGAQDSPIIAGSLQVTEGGVIRLVKPGATPLSLIVQWPAHDIPWPAGELPGTHHT